MVLGKAKGRDVAPYSRGYDVNQHYSNNLSFKWVKNGWLEYIWPLRVASKLWFELE